MKDAAEATEPNQYSVEEPRSTDRELRDARSLTVVCRACNVRALVIHHDNGEI